MPLSTKIGIVLIAAICAYGITSVIVTGDTYNLHSPAAIVKAAAINIGARSYSAEARAAYQRDGVAGLDTFCEDPREKEGYYFNCVKIREVSDEYTGNAVAVLAYPDLGDALLAKTRYPAGTIFSLIFKTYRLDQP